MYNHHHCLCFIYIEREMNCMTNKTESERRTYVWNVFTGEDEWNLEREKSEKKRERESYVYSYNPYVHVSRETHIPTHTQRERERKTHNISMNVYII